MKLSAITPKSIRVTLRKFIRKDKWKGEHRIFCLSMQRTGTTSLGSFFWQHGYPKAGWRVANNQQWQKAWYHDELELIFESKAFQKYQVFEDDPWWYPKMHEHLFHRFPKALFILFTRDSKSWFKSMMYHSGGKTLGNTLLHCKIYGRLEDYKRAAQFDHRFQYHDVETIDNLLLIKEHEEYYRTFYENRNKEVINFFNQNDKNRLLHLDLNDPLKWQKIGNFIQLDVAPEFNIHMNQSAYKS